MTDVGGVGSEGCQCEDKKVDDPKGEGKGTGQYSKERWLRSSTRSPFWGEGREGDRTGEKSHVAPFSTFRRKRTRDDGIL